MSTIIQQPIPKHLPKFIHKYVGNGCLFARLKPYESNRAIAFFNSIYNTAPLFKWSLSIVPLYGIYSGNPSVEMIDFNSSAALAVTGMIWFVYSLMIQPQNAGSRSLALVNFCLVAVNSYNCYRRYTYIPPTNIAAIEAPAST